MNREIKFRVWDKENKIMILKPCWIGFNTNTLGFGDGFAKDFKDIELMQYTGLKDKNGKEIYEGDIVRYWGGEFSQGFWEYDKTIIIKDIMDCFGMEDIENIEIIGNIYENRKSNKLNN